MIDQYVGADGIGRDGQRYRPAEREDAVNYRRGSMTSTLLDRRTAYGAVKRFFDVIVVTAVLIFTFPFYLVISLLILWRMGTPILFRQPRAGWRDRPFTLLKFRTMREAHDDSGNLLPDKARLTTLGRWLRAASLDELPQLWNVLRGDMSLVGPRPLLLRYLDRYTPAQRRRHEVLPGITGWAQVHGRNQLSWEEKFNFDVWYVDHASFGLDLIILLKTLWITFVPQGISARDHVTMPEFFGPTVDTRAPTTRSVSEPAVRH